MACGILSMASVLGFSKETEPIDCLYTGREIYFKELCAVLSHFSYVQLFTTLWTVAHQAPLSMGFSRQDYWSGLPCPPLGDFPNPRIKPPSLTSPALAGEFFTTNANWKLKQLWVLVSLKSAGQVSWLENQEWVVVVVSPKMQNSFFLGRSQSFS